MPRRLSCVFLANYVPKCQMSSGPYGPILFVLNISYILLYFQIRSFQAKLEKEADILRRSGDNFMEFLNRIERWTSRHFKKIADLFRKFDQSGEGAITYDEFKAGKDLALQLKITILTNDKHKWIY